MATEDDLELEHKDSDHFAHANERLTPVRFNTDFYIAGEGDDHESVAALNVTQCGDGTDLWIGTVNVKPKYRSKGLATQLFQAVIAHYGDRVMYLRVQPYFNEPMSVAELKEFYEKLGFADTGIANVMLRKPT